jgi:hypothetical protein
MINLIVYKPSSINHSQHVSIDDLLNLHNNTAMSLIKGKRLLLTCSSQQTMWSKKWMQIEPQNNIDFESE